MRFLPVFLDVTSGPVALVGSGEQAVAKLAAHATVRWYPGHTDVGDEIVQAAAGPGHLEVDFHDPLTASLAGAIAVVSATGDGRDEKVSVRARDAGMDGDRREPGERAGKCAPVHEQPRKRQ